MTGILEGYREGTLFNIKMQDDGLIYAGIDGKALTWMDAIVDGVPVTPRKGKPVEINALWYNAIMFCLELASEANDITVIDSNDSASIRMREIVVFVVTSDNLNRCHSGD